MIGNDLVYLPDWPRREGSRLGRFRRKIYTAREMDWIEKAVNPYRMEALLWAAKEATYKAHLKVTRQRTFAPKKLKTSNVEGSREPKLLMQVDDMQYRVCTEVKDAYLYALAMPVDEIEAVQTFRIETNEEQPEQPLWKGIPIQIEKDDLGIPHGWWQGQSLDMSITHDGGVKIAEWVLG